MKPFVLSLIFLFSFHLSYAQAQDNGEHISPYLKTKKLPSFTLLRSDSTYFKQSDLKKNTATVFVYFNTDCDHCQQEATVIADSARFLTNVQFVFVSNEPFHDVRKFAKAYGLEGLPAFSVTTDINSDIFLFFEPKYAPFLVIYDKNGQFLKTYEGGTSVANIVELTR